MVSVSQVASWRIISNWFYSITQTNALFFLTKESIILMDLVKGSKNQINFSDIKMLNIESTDDKLITIILYDESCVILN